MLYREIIAVYSEIHTKHTNTCRMLPEADRTVMSLYYTLNALAVVTIL